MKLLEPYYRINSAAGVSITVQQSGILNLNACSLSAKGNRLTIEKKLTGIENAEALNRHFEAGTAMALNISGKGILHKQLERAVIIDQGNFNQVLPNANIDDFYVQNFRSGDFSFISVIRKTDADRWLNQLRQQGFIPLSLSLGPFPAEHILPQLNLYGGDLQFDGHVIKRDEAAHWNSYRYEESALTPFALKIESEGIPETLVLSYAAAFQLILAASLDSIKADISGLKEQLEGKLSNQKLKVNGSIILAVLFLLLLINFVLFSGLDSANTRLAAQVGRFAQNTSSARQTGEEVKQKENLLQTLGWDGGINKSALVDQLASLMPEEISLTELAINPVDPGSSRTRRSLVFFSRRISISGTSDKIIPVNEWLARIKTRPWVKNIQLESYTYNNELHTGQFSLSLNY